jgi:hypothetical protein
MGAVGDFFGTSGPSTGQVEADTEDARQVRWRMLADMEAAQAAGGRSVQTVGAPRIDGATQAQAGVAKVAQTPTPAQATAAGPVQAAQIQQQRAQAAAPGEIERVQAAQVGQLRQAQATGVGPVERAAGVQAATVDTGAQGQFRSGQQGVVQSLQQTLAGQGGPSVAEMQLQKTTQANLAAQLAMARGARGGQMVAAQRGAARNLASINQQAAADGALLRAQEQQGARGQLLQALDSARGQDIGLATTQAQIQQQAASQTGQIGLANAGAANQAQQFNAQAQNTAEAQNAQATNAAQAANVAAQNQVALANAGAQNQNQQFVAGQQTDVSKLNATQGNAIGTAQAQLDVNTAEGNAARAQQNSQFNAGATNQIGLANAAQANDVEKLNVTEGNRVGLANAAATNDVAKAQAEADLRAALANQDAMLRARGLDDQQIAGLRGDVISSQGQILNADLGVVSAEEDAKGRRSKLTGDVLSAGGGVAGAFFKSDRHAKTDIRPGSSAVDDFLGALEAHSFRYKNPDEPGAAPGRRYGVMAQDLERSRVGDSLVRDTPSGKAIDGGQAIGALLAALGQVHNRLERVEGRKGAR